MKPFAGAFGMSWLGRVAGRPTAAVVALAVGAPTVSAPAVLAQEIFVPPTTASLPNAFGLGVGFVPDYEGSDEFTIAAGPLGIASWENRYALLRGNALSVNLVDHPFWRFGPTGTLRLGRRGVADDAVDAFEDISTTVELGLFAGVEWIDPIDPRLRFSADIEFAHDVGGEHDGWLVYANARLWHPLDDFVELGIAAGTSYANRHFTETYFGVSTRDSAASNLPAFEANGGFRDLRITPMVVISLGRTWHVGAGIQYRRLLEDAAQSPIVDERGTADQFLGGVSVIYAW